MSRYVKCILCEKDTKKPSDVFTAEEYRLECDTCGIYVTNHFEDYYFKEMSEDDRAMLSAYTRELFDNNYDPPKLHTLLKEGQIKRIVERYKNKTVYDKLGKLILHAERKSDYFGKLFEISIGRDYPISYSKNTKEFKNIIDQAVEAMFLDEKILSNTEAEYKLTWKGWQHLDEIKKIGPLSKKCFVAMSCNEDLRKIYEEGIKIAVKETGYEPIFIEREEHNEKICDLIIAEIRSSKFLIADVTEQRQNVYYEAGFAHGLNRNVIWTCKSDEIKDAHFNTRQYNHIVWEDAEDLKKKLIQRIKATIM